MTKAHLHTAIIAVVAIAVVTLVNRSLPNGIPVVGGFLPK